MSGTCPALPIIETLLNLYVYVYVYVYAIVVVNGCYGLVFFFFI